jgi:hypothetical protein
VRMRCVKVHPISTAFGEEDGQSVRQRNSQGSRSPSWPSPRRGRSQEAKAGEGSSNYVTTELQSMTFMAAHPLVLQKIICTHGFLLAWCPICTSPRATCYCLLRLARGHALAALSQGLQMGGSSIPLASRQSPANHLHRHGTGPFAS